MDARERTPPKALEIAAWALLLLCITLLLVIRGTRLIVAFSLQMIFLVAAVAGIVWYALDKIGVL